MRACLHSDQKRRTTTQKSLSKRPRPERGCHVQYSELLSEREILQNKIPAVTENANQSSDPEKKQAEHGTELYQINHWKYCCKLLIMRSARVLARGRAAPPLRTTGCLRDPNRLHCALL